MGKIIRYLDNALAWTLTRYSGLIDLHSNYSLIKTDFCGVEQHPRDLPPTEEFPPLGLLYPAPQEMTMSLQDKLK